MVPDAEVLSVASEILSSLPIGEFQIKLNHRRYGSIHVWILNVHTSDRTNRCGQPDSRDKTGLPLGRAGSSW